MKKLVLGMFIIITCSLLLINTYVDCKMVISNENNIDQGMLAIMIEKSDGSYELSKNNTWPTDGYKFNETLSNCENGSKLSWNKETKSIDISVSKSDKCYVYFDKIPITLEDVCVEGNNFATCIQKLYTKNPNQNETNIYYHDSSLENGAEDNSYRYAGGGYKVTEKAKEKGYNNVYDVIPLMLESGEVHENNYWWGDNNRDFYLAYQSSTKSKSLKTLLDQAIRDGYVVANDINNYVCFGSTDAFCPTENLYRIIGVFNQEGKQEVKLIKADGGTSDMLGTDGDYVGTWGHDVTYVENINDYKYVYTWDKTATDRIADWSQTALNTTNLNKHFADYIKKLDDGKWDSKVATTNWQVGGMTYQNGHENGAKTVYDYEVGTSKTEKIEEKKYGLMYASDYYFAASQQYWGYDGYNDTYQDVTIPDSADVSGLDYRQAIWNNWLWTGDSEWLITPRTEASSYAFSVTIDGYVTTHSATTRADNIRPCFYLNSDVTYARGSGSATDPYRINL